MKRYIVFLKQVPQSTKIEIDPETKTLKRSSALSQTNPDDLYALQTALDLKKDNEAEVVAITMGPASAENVLREALQRGADRAILLSSPSFAGSDTWCTSLVLAAAVRKIKGYDLLLFGRMAIDGDTAQVGPEVAGQLDIPQITQSVKIEQLAHKHIVVYKKAGSVLQKIKAQLPCAMMISRENGKLDNPTLSGWRRAQKQDLIRWNETDLGLPADTVGLHASPTRVVSTEVPPNKKAISWITDSSLFAHVMQSYIIPSTK